MKFGKKNHYVKIRKYTILFIIIKRINVVVEHEFCRRPKTINGFKFRTIDDQSVTNTARFR